MKRLVVIAVLVWFCMAFATSKAAEKPAEQSEVQGDKPVDNSNKSPFAPSALMRERAKKPVVADNGARMFEAINIQPPVLEGVVVKDKMVLASFKTGQNSIVVEPRSNFMVDGVKFTFVGYADEIATVRDENGNTHDIRIALRTSSASKRLSDPKNDEKK